MLWRSLAWNNHTSLTPIKEQFAVPYPPGSARFSVWHSIPDANARQLESAARSNPHILFTLQEGAESRSFGSN